MRNSAYAPSKRFATFVCTGVAVIFCAVMASAAPSLSPTLISVSAGSTRAVALESVSMRAEPFSLSSESNFSPNDPRTRITLFVMNLDLLAGETQNSLTADAEDAAHVHYPLNVEYVGQVPSFQGVYMVVMRLNDSMTANLGDVLIRLNLHGMGSNRVRVGIGQIGGGPADDQGAVGTPAPQTPPTPVTPLTQAQYQAQFSSPAFPSDQDRLRFLEQASWGPSDADLAHLQSIGMQAWINEQFSTPPVFASVQSDYPSTPLYPQFYPAAPAAACDSTTTCFRDNYSLYPLQKQFFTNALTQPDQLRQRVAFALHQFIVVGGVQLNVNETSWYAPYLQTIDRNAFGNFRTLLFDVTLNPGMGEYLNMRGNSVVNRANPTPNENYAREIMQLFSIGVDTLNQDGTPVLDSQGNRVPSYDQTTIANLARVFTGWDLAANKPWSVDTTISVVNYLDPMIPNVNVNRYDIAQKTLLTDINHGTAVVVPACANCTGNTSAVNLTNTQNYAIASLNTAIDNLFNHPNTGPYVCTQLIRQLVTSNPSPPYVGRCAAAFANNGSNVRGDLKAVVTAILLDPEARGDAKTDPNYGHLREPVLLIAHLLRTFNGTSDGVLASTPFSYTNDLGQNLFNPPTVFSYYPADYGLPGTSLFGPEFGLLDTSTTYKRANFMNTLFLANAGNGIPVSNPNRPSGTQVNYSTYQALAAGNPTGQQLVDALNARLMHGTMSSAMNANIVAAVNAITNANATTQAQQRTQTAIYLVATSAQFQVER
ncbi:MAG: hypothetical protein QOH41_3486 [Blastocatellia bacterium]|jgi:uncharacterized protein (DUF1800 family)|nr:hypothetical protein [Blastocatellia bacterium]